VKCRFFRFKEGGSDLGLMVCQKSLNATSAGYVRGKTRTSSPVYDRALSLVLNWPKKPPA